MADEKNPLDFEEPADGGMVAASSEETENIAEDEEVVEESNESEEKETLPLDVIEEAIGYGLTSSEIEALGSEENIAKVLAILDRQIEAAPAAQESSDSVFGDDDDPFADPDANAGIDNSEVAELRKQVESLKAVVHGQKDRPDADKLFGLLDDDYEDLFGEVEGDRTKTQDRNRDKVLQELETMRAGYKARKRAVPSNRRLFKQAVRSVFGDHESKVVKKKFTESAKKRQTQFLNRVNARDNRKASGNGRTDAIDSVKKFLAERGYTDLNSVETFE